MVPECVALLRGLVKSRGAFCLCSRSWAGMRLCGEGPCIQLIECRFGGELYSKQRKTNFRNSEATTWRTKRYTERARLHPSTLPSSSRTPTLLIPRSMLSQETTRYWGKRDTKLNLPTNSSLSVTLSQDDLRTHTTASCSSSIATDVDSQRSRPGHLRREDASLSA